MVVVGDPADPVAVARAGGRLYAFDDTCTHEECPLSDGRLTADEVECPCHGSIFDLRTGEARDRPGARVGAHPPGAGRGRPRAGAHRALSATAAANAARTSRLRPVVGVDGEAVVIDGRRNERLDRVRGDPGAGAGREAGRREQPAHSRDGPRSVARPVVGLAERVGHPLEPLCARRPRDVQRLGEDEADGEAVGEVEPGADRVAERVVGAAVRQVHRKPGEEAAERHLGAGLAVRAVGHRPREPCRDVAAGLEAERDRSRVAVSDGDAADRLGQRVGPGLHRRAPRQSEGGERIDQRVLRAHQRRRDPELAARLRVGDDRSARHLGAGAGCCGEGHERDPRLGDRRAPGVEVGRGDALAERRPCALSHVERRPAADRDDRVGPERGQLLGDVGHHRHRRLAGRLHERLDAAGKCRDRLVSDRHRPLGAELRKHVGEGACGALPELDPDGQMKPERLDHAAAGSVASSATSASAVPPGTIVSVATRPIVAMIAPTRNAAW